MNLLTSSRLHTYQRCARAHELRYERGIVSCAPAPALVFGTAVHAALEAFWRAWGDGGIGATEGALDALRGHVLDDDAAIRARVMVAAYCARYTRLAARCDVLGVEVEFRTPIVDPDTGVTVPGWTLAGKLDALVRLEDGRVAIVEHKTAGRDVSPGSDYRTRLTLDAQIGVYFDGAEALGHPADVCLYDILAKPAADRLRATPVEDRRYTQPKSRACKACKKAPGIHAEDGIACTEGRIVTDPGGVLYASQRADDETLEAFEERLLSAVEADPDRYLVQAEIVRTDAERAELRRDVIATLRGIELARRKGHSARSAQACFAHGRCDYLDACLAPASLDDPHRYRRLPTIHPELTT